MVTETERDSACRRQQAFAAKARRQSLAIAARAKNPGSDEAGILQELDATVSDLGDEWKP